MQTKPVKLRQASWLSDIKRDRVLYMLVLPLIAWYIIFRYFPMYGIQAAFKDYNLFKGLSGSPWNGFDHFVSFFTGPYFWRVLKNTFMLAAYEIVFAFPVPIILALMLNEVRHQGFRKVVQTLSYAPHFISVVVVAGLVTNFLSPSHGIVNQLIEFFGGEPIYFLTIPEYFRAIYVSMNVWKDAGFIAIIYMAALTSVDPQLYEAARMDGAGKLKQIWHVSLPGILPTIIVMLMIKIGQVMTQSFEVIILLYEPSTYETADIISTYTYRVGIEGSNYGLASAVGLFNSTVALILVYMTNRISKLYVIRINDKEG